jgi:hypothetical protein
MLKKVYGEIQQIKQNEILSKNQVNNTETQAV